MQAGIYFDDILPEFWDRTKNFKSETPPPQTTKNRIRTISDFFQKFDAKQLDIYRAIDLAG